VKEKEKFNRQMNYLIAEGVPKDIAQGISATRPIFSALNIIEAATITGMGVIEVAKIYFRLMERLELIWFREKINDYPIDNHWAVFARADYKGDLAYLQRVLTINVLTLPIDKIEDKVDKWFETNKKYIKRWKAVLNDLKTTSTNEFAMLTVAMRRLSELAQTSRQNSQLEVNNTIPN
jgi:glutamate dehydrogenase